MDGRASAARATPPKPTLADVLRPVLATGGLAMPAHHWKVLRAVVQCRTAALGGHHYRCADCGGGHFVPHSCRNRHCPACQGANGADWMNRQCDALLPVPYFHVVFTLPHALNPLVAQNQAALYRLLFDSASTTLLTFFKHEMDAQPGITAVLHTWSQTLLDHYHVHCIVTAGGLRADGRWTAKPAHWLFPVRALSKMFRAKYRDGLRSLFTTGAIGCHGKLAPMRDGNIFHRWLNGVCRSPWVVYAKRPFAGPQTVLAYLARYTHRVGITNQRLTAFDGGSVTFGYKDYADHARRKQMSVSSDEFVRRFRLHILPPRFVKIRHYGLLSTRNRSTRIAQARAAIRPAAKTTQRPPAREAPTLRCPHCAGENLVLIHVSRFARTPKPPDSS